MKIHDRSAKVIKRRRAMPVNGRSVFLIFALSIKPKKRKGK